jgi:hypothetical protein
MGTVTDISEARARTVGSNSRSEDKICPPDPPFRQIGVDTVSWCWRSGEHVDRLLRLDGLLVGDDHRPLRVVPAPAGAVRLSRRLDGLGTVGAFPAAPLLFVEGRARALHLADEENHQLARPGQLVDTQERVSRALSRLLGAPLDSIGELRRIDLTGELRFARGEDGQELLRILSGLHSPRHKVSTVAERGGPGIQTVYWRTPARSLPVLRAYDKGVESGTAPSGERIRIERQIRYSGAKRPSLMQFLTGDLAAAFSQPLTRWLTGDFIVGTPDQLLEALTWSGVLWHHYWASGSSAFSHTGRHRVPFWTAAKIERVIGTLAILDQYGRSWPAWDAKQRQRRLRDVRDFGLLVLDQPIHIDAHALVTGLCEEWRNAA